MKLASSCSSLLLACVAASCSATSLLDAGVSSAQQPWGVSVIRLAPGLDPGEAEGDAFALTRALAEDATVSLEFGSFDGFFDPFADQAEYEYYRLDYRRWYRPGERLEPYLGVGIGRHEGRDTSEFGFFEESSDDFDYWAVSVSAGGAYWITPKVAFEVGVTSEVLTFEGDGESIYDDYTARLALTYWI